MNRASHRARWPRRLPPYPVTSLLLAINHSPLVTSSASSTEPISFQLVPSNPHAIYLFHQSGPVLPAPNSLQSSSTGIPACAVSASSSTGIPAVRSQPPVAQAFLPVQSQPPVAQAFLPVRSQPPVAQAFLPVRSQPPVAQAFLPVRSQPVFPNQMCPQSPQKEDRTHASQTSCKLAM